MTSRRYQHGCSGGSQAHGEALPGVPGARVVVGFGDGFVYCNLDLDRAFARAVRVSGQ